MTVKLSSLDFKKNIEKYKDQFETVSVLDKDGKILDQKTVDSLTDEELVKIMEYMVWARTLDERTIILNRQGALGNYAPAGGQEASQIATMAALHDGDFFAPTYRDVGALTLHGLPLYKGFLWYKGHVAGNQFDEDFQAFVPQVIVGGTILPAAGVAMGYQRQGKENVVMAYCGDAATSQGDFYEGINFAGVYKAPLITIIQNNRYGISVPISKQTKAETLAQKGVSVGIASVQVDGMDPLAMYATVKQAREYALAGNGPVLIEALTYRFGPHTMSDDPKRYRQDDEVEEWRTKDPLHRMRVFLKGKGLWDSDHEEKIVEQCKQDVKEALARMAEEPAMKVSDLLKHMYEVQPQIIREQIKLYEQKEMN
ncbi:pyruvate dehydrogenase (acetyl-transferring) E1 component subunit alpha [Eremococcus coleocola]|uniref:Pyruvate dehydrogenase E1 component subunit alpha n=1 Tax=Eremococcus coleocola ACS-139-V-Col8 TaxID=908337 RepID=E4KMN8_9LACT|nr:pyruvate dehydrogenase (acetyl-transferring) E1 component subunit alpha [Eremococcus coleocola]EFR31651.1 pyruvate dehydrogenase E1 component, alpha subunit [Eremococcus coleocola ACS-139-V-Col8]